MRPPGRHRQDIVAGLRLRLGGDRHQVLVALAGDVVDRNLDLLLGGPLIDELLRGLVGVGYPVIPEPDRELAGGSGGSDEWRADQRGGRCGSCCNKLSS